MKKCAIFLLLCFGLWGCSTMSCCSLADTPRSPEGANDANKYENVQLPAPVSKKDFDYLGLTEGPATFVLSQIRSDFLIVEIFSVSCHFCQREARQMNDLYGMIQAAGLSQKIKMIGIGMTNSDFEINTYRKRFDVLFPLIADPDSKAYKFTGSVAIPHLIVLKRNADNHYQQVYVKSRETGRASEIWKKVLEATGLKEGS